MQSAEERCRLIKRFDMDRRDPLTAVLKCAGGLIVLTVIASSPWLLLGTDGNGGKAAELVGPVPASAFATSVTASPAEAAMVAEIANNDDIARPAR